MADQPTDDNVVEVLQPSAEPVTWKIGTDDGASREYVQKPLSYMRKMQLFALVGGVVRQAMATGGDGVLGDVFEGARQLSARGGDINSGDLEDADSFVALASSIAVYAPDFLENAYCILLNIPLEERTWAKDMMARPADEGGLSDEEGVGIIKVAVAQNWTAFRDFFGQHLKGVVETAKAQRAQEEVEVE